MTPKNEDKIMVSICCLAYNHVNFISDALEGFLMQETDFGYEILVHDDASTDGTADVIREYEKKYPDLIKPIYQTENQYSKGVKIAPTFNYPRAKGKYIAFCEGDDYWTDPRKLQIQFDYMEEHPEVVCCYHGDYVLTEEGLTKKSRVPPQYQRSYTSEEMMLGRTYISPLTMFYRNLDIFKDYPEESAMVKNGDTFLISMLGQFGSGTFLTNIEPAIYRVHEGGIWSKKSDVERRAMALNTWFWLAEYYSRIGNTNAEDKFRMRYFIGSMASVPPARLIQIFLRIGASYTRDGFLAAKRKILREKKQ